MIVKNYNIRIKNKQTEKAYDSLEWDINKLLFRKYACRLFGWWNAFNSATPPIPNGFLIGPP